MALLAAYMVHGNGKTLEQYLAEQVFAGQSGELMQPEEADVKGFDEYIAMYKEAVPSQKVLAQAMPL